MTSTGKTTFATMTEVFDRVYAQLREDTGENAPNSNAYFAESIEALIDQAGEHNAEEIRSKDGVPDVTIGDAEGQTIGWIYEVNSWDLIRVTDWAVEDELVVLFGNAMGYNL